MAAHFGPSRFQLLVLAAYCDQEMHKSKLKSIRFGVKSRDQPEKGFGFNQSQPFFKFSGLWKIAAMPDVFQTSPNFADGLRGKIEFIRIGFPAEFLDARICFDTLASHADDIGVDQIHAAPSGCGN